MCSHVVMPELKLHSHSYSFTAETNDMCACTSLADIVLFLSSRLPGVAEHSHVFNK